MSAAIPSIADSTAEIRAAMGILALLQADGTLTGDDMRAAIKCVERAVTAIERQAGIGTVALPILTLGEVAARFGHRTGKPQLHAIQGGRS